MEFIEQFYPNIGMIVAGLFVIGYGKTEPIIVCGIALCACGIFW